MTETHVRLRHTLFRTVLVLRRTPLFLRFVCRGMGKAARTWDALDQLDDEPAPDEYIIAGRLVDRGSLHVDGVRNGRRFGEWHATADYEPVDPQPAADVLRDRAKWQAWCQAEYDRAGDEDFDAEFEDEA